MEELRQTEAICPHDASLLVFSLRCDLRHCGSVEGANIKARGLLSGEAKFNVLCGERHAGFVQIGKGRPDTRRKRIPALKAAARDFRAKGFNRQKWLRSALKFDCSTKQIPSYSVPAAKKFKFWTHPTRNHNDNLKLVLLN